MTHKRSSCMLFPLLVAIPLLCAFCLFWFGCGCVFLVCLFSFGSGCGFLVLNLPLGQLAGLCTGPLPVLLWLSLTAVHDNYNSSFCCDFVLVWLWLCVFGLLVFFWFWLWFFGSCWDSSLDCVQVHYSTFVAIDKLTAVHDNYNSSFCCD